MYIIVKIIANMQNSRLQINEFRNLLIQMMGILEYVSSVSRFSRFTDCSRFSVFRARSETGNWIDNLSHYADGAFTVYSS